MSKKVVDTVNDRASMKMPKNCAIRVTADAMHTSTAKCSTLVLVQVFAKWLSQGHGEEKVPL